MIFAVHDLGRLKVDAAADALAALNPDTALDVRPARLTAHTAAEHIAGFDVVLDGTDDFATRFAVNATCYAAATPLVSGAVGRWSGQAAVFDAGRTRGAPIAERLACYQCLVPEAPPDAEPCAAVGVVGALTGVVGSVMAMEAIKLITGAGEPLRGRLWLYDGLSGSSRTVALPPDPACPVCAAPPHSDA